MKRLWIASALLIAVFCATYANTLYLQRLTSGLTDLLTEAKAQGEAGNWEAAFTLAEEAEHQWQASATYLHTTLRHADIDEIFLAFRQVEEYAHRQSAGEYSSASAVLMGRIDLLYEQEQFNLKNLF